MKVLLNLFVNREWNREVLAAMEGKRKPRLWRPMCRLFARQFFIDGGSQFFFVIFRCVIIIVKALNEAIIFPNGILPLQVLCALGFFTVSDSVSKAVHS